MICSLVFRYPRCLWLVPRVFLYNVIADWNVFFISLPVVSWIHGIILRELCSSRKQGFLWLAPSCTPVPSAVSSELQSPWNLGSKLCPDQKVIKTYFCTSHWAYIQKYNLNFRWNCCIHLISCCIHLIGWGHSRHFWLEGLPR